MAAEELRSSAVASVHSHKHCLIVVVAAADAVDAVGAVVDVVDVADAVVHCWWASCHSAVVVRVCTNKCSAECLRLVAVQSPHVP